MPRANPEHTPAVVGKAQQITYSAIAQPKILPFNDSSYGQVKAGLVKVFGPFPIRLNHDEHEKQLRAMEAACGPGGFAYGVLASALYRAGDLELRDE